MEKIIYLKLLQDYNDTLNCKTFIFIKKIIFYFRNFFCIISKKNVDNFIIWTLPFIRNIPKIKIEKIIIKELKNIEENFILVLSRELKKKEIYEILDKFDIKYINGNLAKKALIFKALEYINKLQNKESKNRNVAILVNKNININVFIIKRLALEYKSVKIVSKFSNEFRGVEKKLYNESGIALQFSNDYKKSLKNSSLIINLDYFEEEINKYCINTNAIIINTEKNLKIKTKFFEGILINSYNIEYLDKSIGKYCDFFESLDIYESLMNSNIFINEESIKVLNVIGNNGIIVEKELKNIGQKY